MLLLPKSTEYNHRIPKQKFYENLSVTPELKRAFIEQISFIRWRNKLAVTTLNVGRGERVAELEIFEIKLNQQSVDLKILHSIDKGIPYHILYLLEYNSEYQACIGYKESGIGKEDTFKVNSYFCTDWMPLDELPLCIEGLNLDEIYDNFIRQIAGERLQAKKNNQSGIQYGIKDAIERDKMRQKLSKQIAAIEIRMKNEKQFNKQVKIHAEFRKLKKELEELN